MPDWKAIFDEHYKLRVVRDVTFRKAVSFGPPKKYAADRTVPAGILYESVGFRLNRGVLMPLDRIEVHIWLRDWFGRATDDATPAELQQMVGEMQGQVNAANGDKEFYSRWTLDGLQLLKYDWHAWDHRPDEKGGKVFAVLVRLQAAS